MNDSRNLLLTRLGDESRKLGDVVSNYVEHGPDQKLSGLFDTFIRPLGPLTVTEWYRRNLSQASSRFTITVIDLFSYLGGIETSPFDAVRLRCHDLVKPPPPWCGTNQQWYSCTIEAVDSMDDLIERESSYEHLFDSLATVAGQFREHLRLQPVAFVGDTIRIVRSWMHQCFESDAHDANRVVRMCNLMDDMEIF